MEKKYTCEDCANFGKYHGDYWCTDYRIPEIKTDAVKCKNFCHVDPYLRFKQKIKLRKDN